MNKIASRMHQAKAKNNGRLPHLFVANIEKQFKTSLPNINRNFMNHHYKQWLKGRASTSTSQDDVIIENEEGTSTNPCSITNHIDRSKGGRPKGTTNEQKRKLEEAIVSAKNEITAKYVKVKSEK